MPWRHAWVVYNLVLVAAAFLWRRVLRGITVITITGSTGKTTAKECLSAILSRRFPIVSTIGNQAGRIGHPRMILRARSHHRFAVAEVGILKPGVMWKSALQLRPDIAVILAVNWQHSTNFPTLDAIAREKAKLLNGLSKGGVAILNADDERVIGMANPHLYKTVTFGTGAGCDVRADEISAAWPGRLELQVHAGGKSRRIRTRLVGKHWTPSVLAAIAAARECGVDLDESADALAALEPFTARLEPVNLPQGAVLLRDEYNGSMITLLKALDVLRDAAARRRIAVIGQIGDSKAKGADQKRLIGQKVAEVAESVVFIGEYAREGCEAAVAAGIPEGQAHSFESAEAAAAFLKTELREGDLVLLKALYRDHLSRIYFQQIGTVSCWKSRCRKTSLCDSCPELGFIPAETLSRIS